ncbi:hypothetical protein VTP01DRAFT_6397 [Rhizomucor pusillus]|uniref:uncharacterized protein n=1 Tax=Rhizomucor pusillus TaxID=4840 RepID=UPI0037439F4A
MSRMPGKYTVGLIARSNLTNSAGSHSKKPSDRRDSLKQQQRKNSAGKQKDQQHSSIARNTQRASTPPVGPPAPSPHVPVQHTVGLNGFNSAEVKQFLHQRFSNTLSAYHDTELDASARPEKYESQEKAWGNKGGSGPFWNQKAGVMASGVDFLTELSNLGSK